MSTIARLTWNARDYDLGVDRGVLYPPSGIGEAWNGLISITEAPVESTNRARYQDGIRIHNRQSSGYFAGTINAFSYPPSFYDDILVQSRPKTFGMTYRTTNKTHHKIHLVYNVLLAPSQYVHQQSLIESYSWSFTTFPIDIPGAKRSSHLVVQTSIAYPWTVSALEDILYGTEGENPRLPTPQEVFDIFESNSILQIIDHGDGTWSAIGPDDVIQMLDIHTFQIDWPSAVFIDADSYTISSL